MALESARYIDELVDTNPVTGDAFNTRDDHIKLIKKTTRQSFPGLKTFYAGHLAANGSGLLLPDGWTAGKSGEEPELYVVGHTLDHFRYFVMATAVTAARRTVNVVGGAPGSFTLDVIHGADVPIFFVLLEF